MTRITQSQLSRRIITEISENQRRLHKYSNEVSSGYKVSEPGDSRFSGTISQYRQLLERIEGHQTRISSVKANLGFQDSILQQTSDLLLRAKEVASQSANETVGVSVRAQLANEVFALRDQLVSLANSKYQGKYIYGGTDDDDPPYDATTYTTPSSGAASVRYAYDSITTEPGGAETRSVYVSDELTIDVSTPGSSIFNNALYALERLGRALAGYSTNPASGAPDGTGSQYTLPAQLATQTQAIAGAIDLIENARQSDILPERVTIGARQKRLDAADSLLQATKDDAITALSTLQDADVAESATSLTQAQTALEASYAITTRILNLNILDFL